MKMKNNETADKFRNEGNVFYQQGKFYEALISYNKSLCHAMPQSTQLSLAFANRSIVFFRLKQFDKCLNNIQMARDSNHRNEAKLKLLEKQCKEQQKSRERPWTRQRDSTKNDPWTYLKLSYPANEMIPFIVDCLELKTDEKYGRHIVTTRDLQPGDVIAIEDLEDPVFQIVRKSALYKRCAYCIKSNMLDLIPCSNNNEKEVCTTAMFCNQECLSKARERFHGVYCRSVDSFYNKYGEATMESILFTWRGLLESMHIAQRPEVLQDLMTTQDQPTTVFDFDMRGNEDLKYLKIINGMTIYSDKQAENDHKRWLSMLVKMAPEIFSTHSPETVQMLTEYSTRFAMIRQRNNYIVANRTPTSKSSCATNEGSVILSFGALYNHSCDRNVFPILISNKFVHFVMRPVGTGEQLFIDYGQDNPDRKERQAAILRNYQFECTCPACINDYSALSLPSYDRAFPHSSFEIPETIEGIVVNLQKNFKYIKKNFKHYPSQELNITDNRCYELLCKLSDKSVFPY